MNTNRLDNLHEKILTLHYEGSSIISDTTPTSMGICFISSINLVIGKLNGLLAPCTRASIASLAYDDSGKDFVEGRLDFEGNVKNQLHSSRGLRWQ